MTAFEMNQQRVQPLPLMELASRLGLPEAQAVLSSPMSLLAETVSIDDPNVLAGTSEERTEMARGQVDSAFASAAATAEMPAAIVSLVRLPKVVVIGKEAEAKEARHGSRVRAATLADIEGIVELDLKLFNGAYGEAIPTADEVRYMMTRRWHNVQNGGGWMFTHEVDGELKGFITAFRTNKSAEDFTSWEESTNDGTLDGSVDPEGKYAYVANLTVGATGNKDLLMAAAFSGAIKEGVEYGYFSARMPQFRHWAIRQARAEGKTLEEISAEQIHEWATTYVALTKEDADGNQVPYDVQLRMYSGVGLEMGKLCPEGFQDTASLNYGVVFKAPVPFANAPKPIRRVVSWALKAATRFPKLVEKLL